MELIIYKKAISYLVQIGGKILETDPFLVICQSKEGTLGDATVWVDDYFVVGGKNFVKFVQEKFKRNLLYEELPITSCNIKEIT